MAAGTKMEVSDIVFTTGGGATNAAVTFARQGLKAACIGKVGKDIEGDEVKRALAREGVGTNYIIQSATYPTANAFLVLSSDGERTILVHRGASDRLEAKDIAHMKLSAKWLYITPGRAFGAAEYAMRYAKAHGIRVALNPSFPMLKLGPKYLRRIVRYVDVLIMNREEGSEVTGISFAKPHAIFKKIDEWVPCLAVLTDGERGVMVSDGVTLYEAGVFPVRKLVDMTGAGDAFGSGFVTGLIQGATKFRTPMQTHKESGLVCDLYPRDVVRYAIRLGAANAASVVEAIGAKDGILTRKGFADRRWKRLTIRMKQLV